MRQMLWDLNGFEVRSKVWQSGCRAGNSGSIKSWITFAMGKAQGTTPAASKNNLERYPGDADSWLVSKQADESRSKLYFHAASFRGRGGERSWIWAAVSLSVTRIGPPQMGQIQKAGAHVSLGAGGVRGPDS